MRLYFVHFFAILAVTLASYYPGLDIILSVIYLFVLTLEVLRTNIRGIVAKISLALSLQIPGILLAVANLAKVTQWDLSSYAIFILQYWYVPLLPLISLVSFTTESGTPFYYYMLLAMPWLMSIYLFTVLMLKNKKKIRRPF